MSPQVEKGKPGLFPVVIWDRLAFFSRMNSNYLGFVVVAALLSQLLGYVLPKQALKSALFIGQDILYF